MMAEYICKEDFIKILKEKSPIPFVETNVLIGAVSVFPSADVKPVGHAKWIETTEDAEYDCGYRHIRKLKCSCCGYCQSKSNIADSGALLKSRYCPVCGARMDLEDEDG